ncbi:MAG: ATP-binding cassette domain-containing protein [Methylotenera sp.]|nr:ATP-binding cassette domain-containing protein [Methylotenera sp.]
MSNAGLNLTGYGVCFGSKVILADVTLAMSRQGVTVLMGPVGTGKSTLLCSLVGINNNNPRFKSWGTASLNGATVGALNYPMLVRQQVTQLGDTVEGIVLSASQYSEVNIAKRKEWVLQALQDYQATGLQDLLGKRLIDIDLVFQRMVMIAGAAIANPALLMIDEPTANLNEADAEKMLTFIRHLGEKTKLLVVLHNQLQARDLAENMILLAGGRVQFYGAKDEFFAKTSPNDIVKQFVQTGSVSVSAPDALRENLADDVPPPPPLPQAAIDAIRSISTPVTFAHEPSAPGSSQPSVATAPREKTQAEKLQRVEELKSQLQAIKTEANEAKLKLEQSKLAQPKVEQSAQVLAPSGIQNAAPAQLRELPPPSKGGVSIVAEIGKSNAAAARGPKGFSWIVPDMLAGCPMPGASAPVSYDLDLLASVGITVLITLTEEDLIQYELKAAGLSNVHLSIYDREAPSLSQMHMLLFKMQKLIEAGEVLAVHCLAGIGRTGTVLAAWMIKEGGLSAEEAIRRLRLINPSFVQTVVQEVFLAEFENDILRRMR